MATYPDYPDNRLIVGGVDLSVRFQMALMDGYTLEPPEPKTYTVDIPGGDGVIDLTEALTGDTAYSNRKQEFTFYIIDMDDEQTFEQRKTMVSNFLHGKAFDYQMTMDPGYTYHGRFTVKTYEHSALPSGILGGITITIDADPYKIKPQPAYNLNATGGKLFHLSSGRRPVHPTVQVDQTTKFRVGDTITSVGKGTYRLNDILLREGLNDVYINSHEIKTTYWDEIGPNGSMKHTWDDCKDMRWDDLMRLGMNDVGGTSASTELLSNRSFEGNLDGWTKNATVKVIEHTIGGSLFSHEGSYEVQMDDGARIQQTITGLKPGLQLTVGCWLFSNVPENVAKFMVAFNVGNTITIGEVSNVTTWKRVAANLIIPDGATKATFTISAVVKSTQSPITIPRDPDSESKEVITEDLNHIFVDDATAKQVVGAGRSWESLNGLTWDDIAGTKWYQIDLRDKDQPDTNVYVKYDWKDL